MKRPVAIYFVGAWCFIVLCPQLQSLTELFNRWLFNGELPEQAKSGHTGLWGIMLIWHVVRLINLQAINRWFTVVTLGLLGMIWAVNAVRFAPLAPNPLRFSLIIAAMVGFNWLSVWYLSRQGFREFSVQFVNEKRREKMIRKHADAITKN